MRNKWNTVAWVFLLTGILFLINATSKAGFFPSGHGVGRVPEIISGVTFVIWSGVYLFYRRGRSEVTKRKG